MSHLGVRLVVCSMVATFGLLIHAFSMLFWLEGTPDGDGPGVGIGITVLVGAGVLVSLLGAVAGTALLAVARWRAGRWASSTQLYTFYGGLSACAVGALIASLAAKSRPTQHSSGLAAPAAEFIR